jgi:soluble calcium-activated nucleotidase 1
MRWPNAKEERYACGIRHYNNSYPLTHPVKDSKGIRLRFAVVTDLDHDSKDKAVKNKWFSYFRMGYLTLVGESTDIKIEWDKSPVILRSSISQGGRGMELSELVVFNGKLYTVDDRTGIIYEIHRHKDVVPWVILPDGNGLTNKGRSLDPLT